MPGAPILIVDDNPASLKLAHVLLSYEEHDARTAQGAEQALEVLQTFQPRLILMDIEMPGMDGLALTRQLKADPRTRDIIVVVLTVRTGDEQKARAAGCVGYIVKPIDVTSLPVEIARYLSEADAAGEPPTGGPHETA
jgi:two-component system cell cycle response regulator DivK